MKPKILLLLNDKKMGGVKSILNSLVNSRLVDKFDFKILSINAYRSIFKNWQADVIIVNDASSWKSLPSLLLLKLLNQYAKIMIVEHHYCAGFEQFNVSSLSRFHLMLKLSYRLVDRVVAVAQSQSEWMLKNSLISPTRLTVIKLCRNLDDFFAIKPKPPEHPFILATYGRFCPQKGLDVLLKAMKLIPPGQVKLYIGGGGPQEKELMELAQGLDDVKFCGWIEHVPSFLQKCDAVVIPSRWEPGATVGVEVRAAGKPVIASDIDCLTEHFYNCGILVPPQDDVKLAEAIASLSNHDLETWGKIGRESVKNLWDKYLDEWEALLWKMANINSL